MAVAGATVGVPTELSRLTLTVAHGTNDLKKFRKQHPWSCIIDARSQLGR